MKKNAKSFVLTTNNVTISQSAEFKEAKVKFNSLSHLLRTIKKAEHRSLLATLEPLIPNCTTLQEVIKSPSSMAEYAPLFASDGVFSLLGFKTINGQKCPVARPIKEWNVATLYKWLGQVLVNRAYVCDFK